MMAKISLWNEKNGKRVARSSSGSDGSGEKLRQYANAYPSKREIAQLKLTAELRRWNFELRPPTIKEIQQRYNLTEEHADKFLQKLTKARGITGKKSVSKVVQYKTGGITRPTTKPQEALRGKELDISYDSNDMNVILKSIRERFGDEIRQKGEQTSVREGFIYLVTHPCFPGWNKAGMTIDYEMRLRTYNASDPLSRFEYVKLSWSADRREAEKLLLTALGRNADEVQGEWFKMPVQEAMSNFDPFMQMP